MFNGFICYTKPGGPSNMMMLKRNNGHLPSNMVVQWNIMDILQGGAPSLIAKFKVVYLW